VNDVADAAADADIDYDDVFDSQKKKLSGKKIVLFFVLPVLLLAGGGAGVMMSGLLDGDAPDKKATHASQPSETKTIFYDLPEMLVNLNSTGRRPNFLKIQVSLELTSDAAVENLKVLSPRIVDNFQVYLRELRVEDLRGSAGIYRLREELLARVNSAVRPTKVKDVLFKEMLVQ
jgi:flagellar protein FliL